MKKVYTCMAYARGKPKPGCHQVLRAKRYDYAALKKAGWAPAGNSRDMWKCPACKASAQKKERPVKKFLAVIAATYSDYNHYHYEMVEAVDMAAAFEKVKETQGWGMYEPNEEGYEEFSNEGGTPRTRIFEWVTTDNGACYDEWLRQTKQAQVDADATSTETKERAELARLQKKFGDK